MVGSAVKVLEHADSARKEWLRTFISRGVGNAHGDRSDSQDNFRLSRIADLSDLSARAGARDEKHLPSFSSHQEHAYSS